MSSGSDPGASWHPITFAPTAPPLLLVGDLTYDEQLLDRDQVPAVCDDPEQLLASYAKVRALKGHTPDLIVLPAHDPHAAHKLGTTSQLHA